MLLVYRFLVVLLLLVYSGASFADDAISEHECADDVCVFNVHAADLILPPCEDYSILVAYSKSSGATLIQCNKASASEENKIFVYDRVDDGVKPSVVDGGRFIRPDYLIKAQREGIQDRFGQLPLCPIKSRKDAVPGELLIAEKQPNDSESDPYCYRIHYVLADKGSLIIRSDDGQETPSLLGSQVVEWETLRGKLSHYFDSGFVAGQHKRSRMASIISDKAQLYFVPNSTVSSSMYLVRGDKVEVIEDNKSVNGWYLIRYVTKDGKPIQKWIQARDLHRFHD